MHRFSTGENLLESRRRRLYRFACGIAARLRSRIASGRKFFGGEGFRLLAAPSHNVFIRPRRAAIYARVSTADQNSAPQVGELRMYCGRRGWDVAEIYTDVGSGSAESRPQLSRMMADARRHNFDLVLVWKFDRFGRSLRHLLVSIEELHALGIDFCSYTEAVDTTTPQGRLLFSLLGAFAEFEHDVIRERVRLGQAAAKARGVWIARRPARLDESRILADYKALKSIRETAKLHGVSPRTIGRILKNCRAPVARERGILPKPARRR